MADEYYDFPSGTRDFDVILPHNVTVKTDLKDGVPDVDGLNTLEVQKLTRKLQECWSDLVKKTGQKLQIECMTPEGWINLKLLLSEVPVHITTKDTQNHPTATGSYTTLESKYEMKIALTHVLLYNAYLKELIRNGKMTLKEEDQPEKLKIMVAGVNIISTKIIAKYTAITRDFLVSYKDLLNEVENIKAAFLSCTWSTQMNDGGVLKATEAALLCSILGFEPNVAQFLQGLDEYDKNHQPVLYYIKKHFDNCVSSHPEIFKDRPTYINGADLEKALVALNFSPEVSFVIVSTIDPDVQRTQSAIHMACRYIRFLFSSHMLLSSDEYVGYQPDKVNVWFSEPITRPKVREPLTNPTLQKKVPMINVSENSEFKTFTEEDVIGHCQPGTELWYHATDAASAVSILQGGIELECGRRYQDFSDRNGFYVSNNLKHARISTGSKDCAIVVFKMNIESTQWKVLDLQCDDQTWRKVIRYYRTGGLKEADLTFSVPGTFHQENGAPGVADQLDELDCIKGKICSFVSQILDDLNTELPFCRMDGVPVQQVCVKKNPLAKHFGSLGNICAVIWFRGDKSNQ